MLRILVMVFIRSLIKVIFFALSLTNDENSLMDCDTPSPQFLLKKSSHGDVLVKSELFPWDSVGWKKMHKNDFKRIEELIWLAYSKLSRMIQFSA